MVECSIENKVMIHYGIWFLDDNRIQPSFKKN